VSLKNKKAIAAARKPRDSDSAFVLFSLKFSIDRHSLQLT